MRNRFSKTPRSKISNSSLRQEQRYNTFRKSFDLRQRECEYSREILERSYDRALDYVIFGMDSNYLSLGSPKPSPKASPKPAPKPIHRSNSIFSNDLSPSPLPTPTPTSTSPKISLYSNYSKYSYIPSSSDYKRQFFKLQTHQNQDFTLQSGSPRYGYTNYFSRSKTKEAKSSINNQDIDFQEEEEVIVQEEDQHKQPSKSTKVSNINETSNTEASSIKPLNGPSSQNQPSKIETGEFDASNSRSPSNPNIKSRSSSTKSNSNSATQSSKYKKTSENSQSGSPSGSGIGAHLYTFENKSQSSKTKGKNGLNISIDIENNEDNRSNSDNEMMEELRASELESTPQGSFFEEEEEEIEINSNDIINADNEEENEHEENENENDHEENENEIDHEENENEIDHEENENEIDHEENENEIDHEENENEHIENEADHEESEHEENENEHIENENSNKSHRSISTEEELEFNKHLNTVAQKLHSISSNIKTGSSSNPHSEMMSNTNDEVEISTNSSKLKSQSISQQSKEFTIGHSASSDFSPVVFGKSQSDASSDDSDNNDGIPKPKIDSPKVKNQKGKKI